MTEPEPAAPGDLRAAVEQAYVGAVHTVLLVDDKYPRFGAPFDRDDLDHQRALKLAQACEERDWICGVDDGEVLVKSNEPPRRLSNADLIVLDFNLREGDPAPSLRTLRSLAQNEHPNLVVVYTTLDNLAAVQWQIAASLRTAPAAYEHDAAAESVLDELENSDEWNEGGADVLPWAGVFNGDPAAARTANKAIRNALPEELRRVSADVINTAIQKLLDQRCAEQLEGLGMAPAQPPLVATMGDGRDAPRWVQCRDVFVAVMTKHAAPVESMKAEDIVAALIDALCDWKPNAFQLTAAEARRQIWTTGFKGGRLSLPGPTLMAAWWYHVLGAESGPERSRRVLEFVDVVLDGVLAEVRRDVARRLEEAGLLQGSALSLGGGKRFARAREHAGLATGDATDVDVIHALNASLCSTPYEGHHLTTGTLFVEDEVDVDVPSEAWIVTSPACDTEPRRPSDVTYPWQAALHPTVAIVARRAHVEVAKKANLDRATHGEYVYVEQLGETPRAACRILEKGKRSLQLETLFLADEGKTDPEGRFTAWRVKPSDDNRDVPQLKQTRYRAVAQLRKPYAERLLSEAGNHLSRIGVDFVDHP